MGNLPLSHFVVGLCSSGAKTEALDACDLNTIVGLRVATLFVVSGSCCGLSCRGVGELSWIEGGSSERACSEILEFSKIGVDWHTVSWAFIVSYYLLLFGLYVSSSSGYKAAVSGEGGNGLK